MSRDRNIRWALAEPELLSTEFLKMVAQNETNDHTNHNNSHSYHDEIEIYQGISKGNT